MHYSRRVSRANYHAPILVLWALLAAVVSLGIAGTAQASAAPTVESILPNQGPTAGGTLVKIIGTGFVEPATVTIGGAATAVTVVSPTEITAKTQAQAAGTAEVVVKDSGGTSTLGPTYTYVAAPTVESVTPKEGPVAGGATVTIKGTHLNGATAVKFGPNAATVKSDTPTEITATSPAGSLGTVHVTVTTPGGTSAETAADEYTYVAAPTVESVTPKEGPVAGGATVTIKGTHLNGATAVKFGPNAATVKSDTPTEITATSPAGSGTVHVTVTTPGGTSAETAADEYTYVAAPTVESVTPKEGPVAGGATVTIKGTHLNGATAVKFGSTADTSL